MMICHKGGWWDVWLLTGRVRNYWSVINTTGDDRGREALILQRFPLWLVKHSPVANLRVWWLSLSQTACRGLIPYLWYLGWAKRWAKTFLKSTSETFSTNTLLTLHHVVFHREADTAVNDCPVQVQPQVCHWTVRLSAEKNNIVWHNVLLPLG